MREKWGGGGGYGGSGEGEVEGLVAGWPTEQAHIRTQTLLEADELYVWRKGALITSWSMEEALTRAQTFLKAGELCVLGGGGGSWLAYRTDPHSCTDLRGRR